MQKKQNLTMYLTTSWLLVLLLRGINGQIGGGALPPKDIEGLATTIDTSWFNQTLDHFSNDTPTYWQQRYFVNPNIWQRQSFTPVFLLLGGEGDITKGWMTGGAWVYWAYRYGALLFQLEHRFYGQSHPTADTSVENLKYLTSEQAIEDTRNFIQTMNAQYNLSSGNKWILFGGSYPGALVAWHRLKLPELVYGGISSSGPLQAKADFYEYDQVVRASLETYSKGCSTQLTKAIKSIQRLFKTNAGTQSLVKKFNICYGFNVNNAKDLNVFYQTIFSRVAKAVQYNEVGSNTEKISYVCSYLNNASIPDPVDRLAQLTKATSTGCLYAYYKGSISFYQDTNWNSTDVTMNSRQWIYQTCNEFGYYQTSEAVNDLLSDTLPLEFFTQQCTDIFGPDYNSTQLNDAVDRTNQNYGGTNINVDRVVFVQGSIDPWHALGIVKPTAQSPFIYINGTTHCQDMNTPQAKDSIYLKQARDKIQSYLDLWYNTLT